MLVIFSVHGGNAQTSRNLINAAKKAKKIGMKVVSFVGFDGGELKKISDVCIHFPINSSAHIESLFSLISHLIIFYLKGEKWNSL